jgi:hypothetical protein
VHIPVRLGFHWYNSFERAKRSWPLGKNNRCARKSF